jgi:hypothetical protein
MDFADTLRSWHRAFRDPSLSPREYATLVLLSVLVVLLSPAWAIGVTSVLCISWGLFDLTGGGGKPWWVVVEHHAVGVVVIILSPLWFPVVLVYLLVSGKEN